MDALALEHVLRRVLLASLAAPAVLALGAGCGGQAVVYEGGDSGHGSDSAADAGVDTGADAQSDVTTGGCYTMGQPPAGFCQVYDLPLIGDPNSCGIPTTFTTGAICNTLCQQSISECELVVEGGQNLVQCVEICRTGRKPPGFEPHGLKGTGRTVGEYFARAAELEAASVHAFHVLRDELVALGAPRALVAAAERAARDEVRHARVMGILASRWGVLAEQPRMTPQHLRSLEDVAVDNAVEGCVGETFGALVAMHQARAAKDARVRRALKRVAADETRHAALGWQLAAWAEPRLRPEGRARVAEARRTAVEELRRGAATQPPAELLSAAGLPDAATASAIVKHADRALWA